MMKKYGSDYIHYPDDGCEFAASCLNCPLPKCVLDEPGGQGKWLKRQRNKEIIKLYREGKSREELAEIFKVSVRTIHRALKKRREDG